MPCTADLIPVAPSLVNDVWPHVRPLIKSAVDRENPEEFAGIESEVLAGLQQLWLAWNGTAIRAAAVTRIVTIGDRKTCIIVAVGGHKLKEWIPLIAGLEEFAKSEGCRATRIIGRRGWERILQEYRAKYVVMEKELS